MRSTGSEPRQISSEPIKVLIAEDDPIVVQGLSLVIGEQAGFGICATSDHAGQTLAMIELTSPDVVLVDLSLRDSDGLELIRGARQRGYRLPMLVLSSRDQVIYAEQALAAGANGYVHKSEAVDQIIDGLRAVLAGETFLSPKMRDKFRHQGEVTDSLAALTRRERDVFQLIANGHRTRRIGEILNLSVSTVETHSRNIRKKLGLRSARDLVRHAARWSEGAT